MVPLSLITGRSWFRASFVTSQIPLKTLRQWIALKDGPCMNTCQNPAVFFWLQIKSPMLFVDGHLWSTRSVVICVRAYWFTTVVGLNSGVRVVPNGLTVTVRVGEVS